MSSWLQLNVYDTLLYLMHMAYIFVCEVWLFSIVKFILHVVQCVFPALCYSCTGALQCLVIPLPHLPAVCPTPTEPQRILVGWSVCSSVILLHNSAHQNLSFFILTEYFIDAVTEKRIQCHFFQCYCYPTKYNFVRITHWCTCTYTGIWYMGSRWYRKTFVLFDHRFHGALPEGCDCGQFLDHPDHGHFSVHLTGSSVRWAALRQWLSQLWAGVDVSLV